MRRFFLLAALLLAPPVHAACPGGADKVAQAICASPDLTTLSAEIDTLTAEAQTTLPLGARLRRAQAEFIAGRAVALSEGTESLAALLRNRVETLRKEIAAARAIAVDHPAAALAQTCLIPMDGPCRVIASGPIRDAPGPSLVYQVVTALVDGEPSSMQGWVIAARKPDGTIRPILWRDSDQVRYGPPIMAHTPGGALLAVDGPVEGTGNNHDTSLFRWTTGGWREVDNETWVDDLNARLPPGWTIVRAVNVKLANLTGHGLAYRMGAGCPTHANVTARLALREDRIVITSIRLDRECNTEAAR